MPKKVRREYHDYRVRWENYRAFRDTGWLTIKPLTILLGANNAGKSSILSPLLLMNQTIASRDKITPIVTRGSLFDGGNFQDILHCHDDSRKLSLSFDFHTHAADGETAELGDYPPGGVRAVFETAGESAAQSKLASYEVFDVFRRSYMSLVASKSGFSLRGMDKVGMTAHERAAVRRQTPANFLFSPSQALYELRRPKHGRDSQSDDDQFSAPFSQYIGVLGYAYQEVVEILRRLSYIGPLRDRPRRYYEVLGEIPLTVGPRGQNTANLLSRRFDELSENLNRWIVRFGLGQSADLKRLSSDVFSIVLRNEGYETNIADAGFGASQVLPLIVQSLVSPERALTIAEQPEIHLNPRLQRVLGELFVEMATSDHRVIVETHSEHLLLSVRKLVAEGRIESDRVAIYFVERAGTESSIREIALEPNGGIPKGEWPKGFFDDALVESISLARAQATRSAERRSG